MPAARITDRGSQSIVTDYLGTPATMYDNDGNKTWEANLDIYGRVRTFVGSSLSECPFRYQGQYEDAETGLYYNRFRYYDPSSGSYISQDPIGLLSGEGNFYAYVKDPNDWIDIYGLNPLLPNAPTYAGVYHIVGANGEKYVGSSVNIAERLTTKHTKAAQIINSGNYTITCHQVNLGTATTPREINHILRAHEQQVFRDAGYLPNQNGVLNANNPAASHKLSGYLDEVQAHGAGFVGEPETSTKIKPTGCH